jgi:hypothetical protein
MFGLTSFWIAPEYEKGVWVVMGAVSNCLSAVLGAKFGLAIPGEKLNKDSDKDKV